MSAMDTEQSNEGQVFGIPAPILEHYRTLPPTAIRGAEIQLRELFASAIDRESEHIERDRILLELLDALAPEVATLVLDREDEVGYWYA